MHLILAYILGYAGGKVNMTPLDSRNNRMLTRRQLILHIIQGLEMFGYNFKIAGIGTVFFRFIEDKMTSARHVWQHSNFKGNLNYLLPAAIQHLDMYRLMPGRVLGSCCHANIYHTEFNTSFVTHTSFF